MGCDIHLYVERRRADGTWEWVPPPPDPRHPEWPHWYNNRNYDAFAILADVRNGRGFAGMPTGDGFNPIAPPRGIPADVSPEALKEYTLRVVDDPFALESDEEHCVEAEQAQRWVEQGISVWVEDGKIISHPDWHSASWFTVAELLAYDWEQVTRSFGILSVREFRAWRKAGTVIPDSYCGAVFSPNIEVLTEREMEQYLEKDPPGDKRYFCRASWSVSYAESARDFLRFVRETLASLGEPDAIRIVFWFDN